MKKPKNAKSLSDPSYVVGVGASTGGLRAFQKLLKNLPPRTEMAFVLIPHLDPKHESSLAQILASFTSMEVAEIKNGVRVQPNRVYVIPPARAVALSRGRLELKPRSEAERGHVIDRFFVSLAKELKTRAAGVVLSGSGSDGAQGLAAIRAEGGITFAQDAKTAAVADMPKAAVSTGAADFVLSPEMIARELAAIGRHACESAARAGKTAKLSSGAEHSVKAIIELLRRTTGADFSHYKRTTLLRRLERRMALRRIKDFAQYAAYLEKSPTEARSLRDEILIHVTAFFREPEAFKALRRTVFPALIKRRPPNAPLRLWVPGCSTGEEVYSLAIALKEFLEQKGAAFPIQIFGTDVSEKVVAQARHGKYSEPAVPPEYRRRYFSPTEDGQYQVSKAIRELCVFAAHDLTRDPPYSNLDLISCRNVLIYFDQAFQERVVPIFHYALNVEGFLLLGPSESIDSFADIFTVVEKTHRIFAKRAVPGRLPTDLFPAGRFYAAVPREKKESTERSWSLADLSKEADRIVLSSASPGVIVSESLEIVQFRGDLGAFLTSSRGKANFNLAKMAHEGLLFPVTQAIEQAKRRRVPIVLKEVKIRHKRESRTVQIQVVPLPGLPSHEIYFLVLFADTAAPAPAGAETLDDVEPETRERYLERELRATRQSLESVIEKQQATNEDLQSVNEELRSRNEEYQSSLEELQTTHEELQSTNEELSTLNEELRVRTAQLDEKNADLVRINEELRRAEKVRGRLAAIVESSDDAIVAKTLDGIITDWNDGAEKLFGYTAAEAVGQPIAILIPPEHSNEEADILERIRHGKRIVPYETVRRRKDGTLVDVSVGISPIFDAQGRVVGASKIARDITDRKEARRKLEREVAERTAELRASNQELESFCYAVAHDLRAPLRAIAGFSQFLQRKLADHRDPEIRADFERIVDAASLMSELIDGLLKLSRLTRQEIVFEPVDLSRIAEEIAETLARADPGRNVRFAIQPGLRVRGDAELLRVLLQNLLENSWKFTSKHPAANIEFGAVARDGETAYFVRDDGAGFDPAHAGKLFMAFHRLHHVSEFPGTGIGLATAKRIVSRHGGRLWAEGAVEKGATFSFTIGSEAAPTA